MPTKQPNLKELYELHSKRADAIVVLTGGRARIKCAIDILEKNYASALFISGVGVCASLRNFSVYMNNKALSCSKTYLGYKAQDTLGNAHEIKQFLWKQGFNSIILVTSDYHILRSLLLLRYAGVDAEVVLYPVFSQNKRRKWLTLALREYNAILYFFLSKAFEAI
jgi:uncharacterized SAM-binding protein YcdF (DUF218 family)